MSDDRESAVLDRIEAFRRRRPRLVDDVVTLAHGAGGGCVAERKFEGGHVGNLTVNLG